METIFTLDDEADDIRMDLDELYEKKKQYDLNTVTTYNKILKRIHHRIKNVSNQHIDVQYCWYVVPEVMIGVPRYDNGACIAYVIDKLQENGFIVKYTHPNLLFISWKHWMPSYVRQELKKKTGIQIDGMGKSKTNTTIPSNLSFNSNSNSNLISGPPSMYMSYQQQSHPSMEIHGHGQGIQGQMQPIVQMQGQSEYRDISSYKPSGLIYNQDLLRRIHEKTTR
jgi:hypothetical protein